MRQASDATEPQIWNEPYPLTLVRALWENSRRDENQSFARHRRGCRFGAFQLLARRSRQRLERPQRQLARPGHGQPPGRQQGAPALPSFVFERIGRHQHDADLRQRFLRFELQSNFTNDAGKLYGTWSETTRRLQGNFAGSVDGDTVRARVNSDMFSAFLNVRTVGAQQTVVIESPGSTISNVSISLRKS